MHRFGCTDRWASQWLLLTCVGKSTGCLTHCKLTHSHYISLNKTRSGARAEGSVLLAFERESTAKRCWPCTVIDKSSYFPQHDPLREELTRCLASIQDLQIINPFSLHWVCFCFHWPKEIPVLTNLTKWPCQELLAGWHEAIMGGHV